MRLRHGLAALGALLVLAGCGGSGAGGDLASVAGADTAASVAPATAALYVSVNTDLDSEQWQDAQALLERFPGREDLVRFLRDSLADEGLDWEQDVRPALGPTVEIVALDFESGEDGVVFLVQPDDEAKLQALAQKGDEPVFTRAIEEWTVVAASEAALDRFEQAIGSGDKLEDDDAFSDLMGDLPAEALLKGWVDGEQLTGAADTLGGAQIPQFTFGTPVGTAFAAEASDDGLSLVFRHRSEDVDVDAREWGELLELVPGDAFAFVNAHGQDGQLKVTERIREVPQLSTALGEIERTVGVTLEDLSSLFDGEILLWVAPGPLIPEVTLVLEVEDEAAARATVDRLVEAAGGLGGVQSSPRRVGDVEATEVDLGQLALLYATVDGKLVVTTLTSGIEAAAGDAEDKLVDSDAYKDALEAADVPGDEKVALWVDLARTFDVIEGLAQLGEQPIPPDVRGNLEPLGSVLLSATPDFEDASGRVFVHVR